MNPPQIKSIGGHPTLVSSQAKESSASDYIKRLCGQFPTLACEVNIAADFDTDMFKCRHHNVSDGEWWARAFILAVWFGRTGEFDMMKALGCWDAAHKAAFATWVAAPFWP